MDLALKIFITNAILLLTALLIDDIYIKSTKSSATYKIIHLWSGLTIAGLITLIIAFIWS